MSNADSEPGEASVEIELDVVDAVAGCLLSRVDPAEVNRLEQFAVLEFWRLAQRREIEVQTAKCRGIQVLGNFTTVLLEVGGLGGFKGLSGELVAVSKRIPKDSPNLEVGVRVAVGNLVASLAGLSQPYTVT